MYNKQTGSVLELFISTKEQKERINKQKIQIDTDGVIDDKFYAKNTQRSVLITSIESYALAEQNNINTPYGSLGENILIDINPYELTLGDRLKIGNTIVQISQNCTICNSLSKIDKSLPKLLETNRGIFAQVIVDGEINKGDVVTIFQKGKTI